MDNFNYEEYYIWQEREVRFDISKKEISLRKGEKCLDTISNIEDSKGNNGDVGCMMFTNLRIVWFCVENLKLNLSIGYDCIISSDVKPTNSKVSGESMALFIKVKFGNNRFEFVFNAVANTSPQLFNTFTYVIRLYEYTRLYRDVKLKGQILTDKSLNKLNLEDILFGVKNVSLITYVRGEEVIHNNGELLITNIRIIWFSPNNEVINLSLPWIDVRLLKLKSHQKYGQLLMVETNKYFSSQLFNFKLHVTDDIIESIYKQMIDNYLIYLDNPILGVWIERDDQGKIINKIDEKKETDKVDIGMSKTTLHSNKSNNISNSSYINTNQNSVIFQSNQDQTIINNIQQKNDRIYNKLMKEFPDDIEIIETKFFNEQAALMSYLNSKAERNVSKKDIVYNSELGLAMEKLPTNQSLESIWKFEF